MLKTKSKATGEVREFGPHEQRLREIVWNFLKRVEGQDLHSAYDWTDAEDSDDLIDPDGYLDWAMSVSADYVASYALDGLNMMAAEIARLDRKRRAEVSKLRSVIDFLLDGNGK